MEPILRASENFLFDFVHTWIPVKEKAAATYLHVDLDEAGGRDLVVEHPKGVQQEMLRILTNSGLQISNIQSPTVSAKSEVCFLTEIS